MWQLVTLSGLLVLGCSSGIPAQSSLHHPSVIVTIGDASFHAELASTAEDRDKGLSGRKDLPPKTGMLFMFETETASGFWMKEMRFPLDLVWIGKNCKVVDITSKVPYPAPGTPSINLPIYESQRPSAYTFEINAGETELHGVKVGTQVRFSKLPKEMSEVCR